MAKLISGREVKTFGAALKVQCNLNGGTATFDVKTFGADDFVTAKTFDSDEVVIIEVPEGWYRATLTGSAVLAAVSAR